MKQIEEIINHIQYEYDNINNSWKKSKNYEKINLKKSLIKDLNSRDRIMDTIFEYRDYINKNIINFSLNIQRCCFSTVRINTRVKAQNSIEYKIYNYQENHENGNIPINKCLNDIYGIRIITNKKVKYEDIQKIVSEKYKNLKCIDSSKGSYKAIHIYFKDDNCSFPWELQIWNQEDEKSNLESHKKYKQGYTKWENESKGGKSNG